jgi:hypothetical protein
LSENQGSQQYDSNSRNFQRIEILTSHCYKSWSPKAGELGVLAPKGRERKTFWLWQRE